MLSGRRLRRGAAPPLPSFTRTGAHGAGGVGKALPSFTRRVARAATRVLVARYGNTNNADLTPQAGLQQDADDLLLRFIMRNLLGNPYA